MVSVAIPVAFSVAIPRAVVPLKNYTFPVGAVGPDVVTVAARTMGWPLVEELGLLVNVVVVVA